MSIDPRYIGFWPDHFELLRDFRPSQIADFAELAPNPELTEVIDSGINCKVVRAKTKDETFSWKLTYDSVHNVPIDVELVGFSGIDVHDHLRTDWTTYDGFSLPSRAEFRRTYNGQVERHEIWTISVKSVNKPIPDSLATWNSLGIWDGAVVRRMLNDKQYYQEWRNGRFTKWEPVPLMDSIGDAGQRVPLYYVLIAIVVVFVGVMGIVVSIHKRRRPA